MNKPLLILFLVAVTHTAFSQTPTDGLMMDKGNLCTGFMYTFDQWKNYWEGDLKRENGNIGKITTQSIMWYGVYGITDKLNVMAMLPYMKMTASQGTLHSMEGLQDLSLAVKWNFLEKELGKGKFRAFGVLGFSTPMSDYTPDFFPLSLGTHTTNIAYRLTANYKLESGWFINASGAYTWRSNTKLDRPAYFDGEEFVMSDEVRMPNVFDVFVSLGYHKGIIQAELELIQQNTLGNGDILRQGGPFVSNEMDYTKIAQLVMVYPPFVKNLAIRASSTQTLAGRNVGQSTTWLVGALYTLQFSKPE